ncbi:MAG: transposase [Gemmatimonadetes bacterium]|nr:transposase [Gemmatimonadota bacterium]
MAPTDPFATNFAGAAQLVRVERHVWKGKAITPTITVVYGVTSRAALEANPDQLLAAVREHWSAIENGQHHRRDRTFREDNSPVRDPNATPCYAGLRSMAIFLCGQQKRAQRRPQDYHLPNFLRWAGNRKTAVIRWFTTAYHPP